MDIEDYNIFYFDPKIKCLLNWMWFNQMAKKYLIQQFQKLKHFLQVYNIKECLTYSEREQFILSAHLFFPDFHFLSESKVRSCSPKPSDTSHQILITFTPPTNLSCNLLLATKPKAIHAFMYLLLNMLSHSLQHTWSSILRARLIDLVHSVLGPRADSRAPNSKKR